MGKKYRVKWFKIDDPSIKGQGEPVSEGVARAAVAQANKEYSHLYHYVELVNDTD